MSARFEFAFPCSPGEIRSFDLQAIREASIPLPVMNRTNRTANPKKQDRIKSKFRRLASRAPICKFS